MLFTRPIYTISRLNEDDEMKRKMKKRSDLDWYQIRATHLRPMEHSLT